MTGVRVLGRLDGALAWDGARLYGEEDLAPGREPPARLEGLAGSVQGSSDGVWRVARDRLGLGKLFWVREDAGAVALAARPSRLIECGHDLDEIRAVPRGSLIDLATPADGGGEQRPAAPAGPTSGPAVAPDAGASDPDSAAAAIREALDGYLAAIARAHPDAPVYVCLSGGLDSSGMATLVRERFPSAIAVSFELERGAGPSEDRQAGERVARELDMPLLEATIGADDLLAHLDTVLVEGVDWRDFNVHAGLVNAALAATIREAEGSASTPLVFTGDLANEFLVDYHAEQYRGATYYRLPRLSPTALRASLVEGLDTSHREVGVFGAWNLQVVQPYAVALDAYMSLPDAFLRLRDRKERLCRAIFGGRLPAFVYDRPKARAQTGGAEGAGVLGLCVDRGMDGAWLRRRFAELHGHAGPEKLDRFIRAGRYRSAAPALGEDADERA